MKKMISLIRACMTDNMNIFRVKNKRQTGTSNKLIPIVIAIIMLIAMYSYANMLMEPLAESHLEHTALTIFAIVTTILTFVEGIYKSSGLLFNCKDDNLLLSLPIKKSTVIFVRIFKFYIFELIYNSLFLLPAMVAYIKYVNVDISYYIVSISALLILPILPIIVSCIIGFVISAVSSKFKFKNIVEIVVTTIILLIVFYFSFNMEGLISNLTQNASNINEIVSKIYYPAGIYIKLITEFNIQDLLIFVSSHILVAIASIFILSKIYFKINSNVKSIKSGNKNLNYKIKTRKPLNSLIKKELKKFINTPVFVVNAGFGLVLFVAICVFMCIKFNDLAAMPMIEKAGLTVEQIKTYIPVILFGLICMASFMSSITSSMISLEGKSFVILKSLPVKPFTIILSKIFTAVIIMIPFILVGDIIVFVMAKFNIFEIIMIIIASFILPLIAETIGILLNLKYPKMDAENDTEVVKQSMSSTIAVFTGMILTGLTTILLVAWCISGLAVDLVILISLLIYSIVFITLLVYLNKKSVKEFNKINV